MNRNDKSGSGPSHTAEWAYHLWQAPEDEYDDKFIELLERYHGDGTNIWKCHNCGTGVHFGNTGWNEQTASYIRFGPVFICGGCMREAFDLPNVPSKWPSEQVEKDD